jgi:hypothetical protein
LDGKAFADARVGLRPTFVLPATNSEHSNIKNRPVFGALFPLAKLFFRPLLYSTITVKKPLYHFSLCALFAVQHIFADDIKTNDWGTVTNGLQMSIGLKDKSEITVYRDVELLIHFRNVSTNQTFSICPDNVIEKTLDFSFTVISPLGKDISPIPNSHPGASSGAIIPLAPSQTLEFDFDLSRLCKFDSVGIYKVIAKYSVLSRQTRKPFTVISNPLYVSVVR